MADLHRDKSNNIPVSWGEVLNLPEGSRDYPSDIDGFRERRGQFLYLEWKHYSAQVDYNSGQMLAYRTLAADSRNTVLVIWGCYETWAVHKVQILGHHEEPVPHGNDWLQRFMGRWWDYASSK